MGLDVYKKGQGSLARLAAYAIGIVLIAFGVLRFFATINVPNENVLVPGLPLLGDLSVYKVVSLVLLVAALIGLHLLLNRPRSVDLLIETEQEMKKVSWPTLPEVWNATLVVVLVTVLLAVTMYGFDLALSRLFKLVF
jgi:preprotein translocase SecE subunit